MRYKFPRIYHFSDSPNLQNDDRRHEDESVFIGKEVVGTIKVDGESTTIYSDHIHARSIDSMDHESRTWVKNLKGHISYSIPVGWRICGENLYAVHSIEYTDLRSYFYLYNVFNEKNIALSWDETVEWAGLLDLEVVDVFYRGVYDRQLIHEKYEEYCKTSVDPVEGYVVRIADRIPYEEFTTWYIKYVRKGHVQCDEHWMTQKIKLNGLRRNL